MNKAEEIINKVEDILRVRLYEREEAIEQVEAYLRHDNEKIALMRIMEDIQYDKCFL